MPKKKGKTKNYMNLSLKIFGISVIAIFVFLGFGFLVNDNLNSLPFKIVLTLIYGSFGVLVLSLLYFFVSVICNQFRDKKILWGVIDILLLISFLVLRRENGNVVSIYFAIALTSCLYYYFYYIRPRL